MEHVTRDRQTQRHSSTPRRVSPGMKNQIHEKPASTSTSTLRPTSTERLRMGNFQKSAIRRLASDFAMMIVFALMMRSHVMRQAPA